MSDDVDAALDLVRRFGSDPWLAHNHLFRHRHPEQSPDAHRVLVSHIYSPEPRKSIEGFRGFAKSTFLEEAAVLRACYRRFHNMVILGSSYSRAVDRLGAVKNEFEINPFIERLFGNQRADSRTWQEGRIVLANGVCIQALGREQSMLGIKYLEWRPDAVLIDDLEDPEEVRTDAEREQTWRWFITTFLPSLDHPLNSWIRVLGTRRGTGSLPERLEKERDWSVVKFPIEYVDGEGTRRAMWPSKFPLQVVDRMREIYRGDMHTWMQEYMCQASSESDRVFTRDMIVVTPKSRTWEACYAMIDPARTVNQNSATTGWAVWSWVRNRMVVWAADAQYLRPDDIVALAFALAEMYDPVWVGVEEDGLNEWLLQPMRQEAVRRGITIPLKAMRAPRGKLSFIRGLQPFFHAREVEFAQPLEALTDQLISYPTGKIDAPNALAYALLMRPGMPIYDNFGQEHIVEEPDYQRDRPLYIAANATATMTVAALVQQVDGRLSVLADWVREGMASEVVPQIYAEAALMSDATRLVVSDEGKRSWAEMLKNTAPGTALRRQAPVWIVPPRHGDKYTNVGLMQAAKHIPSEVRFGGQELTGQQRLAAEMGHVLHGRSSVEVAATAKWTLRALAGGYTRAMVKGRLQEYAEEGPYRLLMEGIESFVATAQAGLASSDDEEDIEDQPWATNRHGQRYRSAMPARGG